MTSSPLGHVTFRLITRLCMSSARNAELMSYLLSPPRTLCFHRRLFVCLLARLRNIYSPSFTEFATEETFRFWWHSRSYYVRVGAGLCYGYVWSGCCLTVTVYIWSATLAEVCALLNASLVWPENDNSLMSIHLWNQVPASFRQSYSSNSTRLSTTPFILCIIIFTACRYVYSCGMI